MDKIDTRETDLVTDGRMILHEESNETWYLADRNWRISMLETLNSGETQAVMHRPLRSEGMSYSFFENPEMIPDYFPIFPGVHESSQINSKSIPSCFEKKFTNLSLL